MGTGECEAPPRFLCRHVPHRLAVALIAGSGLLLWSVLTAGPGADRFARADAMVAGDRSIVRGGADETGSGLDGLRRRAEALDGFLSVTSPAGGPTTINAELPCAS